MIYALWNIRRPRGLLGPLLCMLGILSLPGALSAQELGLSIIGLPSPVYAGSWDPAYQGTSIALSYAHDLKNFKLEVGLEAGIDLSGSQALVSLGAALPLSHNRPWEWRAGAALLAGLVLSRPHTGPILGLEAESRLRCELGPRLSLEGGLGFRWTAYLSPLPLRPAQSWELPLSLGLYWKLGDYRAR